MDQTRKKEIDQTGKNEIDQTEKNEIDQTEKNGFPLENLIAPYKLRGNGIESEGTSKSRKQHGFDATKVEFKDPISTEKYYPTKEMLDSFSGDSDISIIGFWRKDEDPGDFYCYHYFYVQNLIVKDDKSLFEAGK